MKKIVYIIPGQGGTPLDSESKKLTKLFEAHGIAPIHVKIKWDRKKPIQFDEYVEDFLEQYKKPKNTKVYILGFSFGATIAFLSAAKTKPDLLILCSLSPYFKEDFKRIPSSYLKFWKKTFIKSDYTFSQLAPRVKSKTQIFVGAKEGKSCLIRASDTKKRIVNSSLTVIKNAKHNIVQKEYLAELEKFIFELNS